MTKEKGKYKPGDAVKDKVHKLNGVIESIVGEPEDGHHATFYNVRLSDGRLVHLVESQME